MVFMRDKQSFKKESAKQGQTFQSLTYLRNKIGSMFVINSGNLLSWIIFQEKLHKGISYKNLLDKCTKFIAKIRELNIAYLE
jgi:hypothetical protein